VHVRLTAKAKTEEEARSLNAALEAKVRERLETFIFGTDEETYESILSKLLLGARLRVAVTETGLGTSVIQTMKGMEGSRQFFALGMTVCEPAMAEKLLACPSMREAGIVSAAAARSLAEGVRALADADLGLAVIGRVAQSKDQDHVAYIALATPGQTTATEQKWPFALRFIENRITKMALAEVRKYALRQAGR
jgi:nicotinamide-nucleotide amidase